MIAEHTLETNSFHQPPFGAGEERGEQKLADFPELNLGGGQVYILRGILFKYVKCYG